MAFASKSSSLRKTPSGQLLDSDMIGIPIAFSKRACCSIASVGRLAGSRRIFVNSLLVFLPATRWETSRNSRCGMFPRRVTQDYQIRRRSDNINRTELDSQRSITSSIPFVAKRLFAANLCFFSTV
jgi:hypothetical protein